MIEKEQALRRTLANIEVKGGDDTQTLLQIALMVASKMREYGLGDAPGVVRDIFECAVQTLEMKS